MASAIGLHRFSLPNEQLILFDKDYDDGNLATDMYRTLAGHRDYYVVAE